MANWFEVIINAIIFKQVCLLTPHSLNFAALKLSIIKLQNMLAASISVNCI